VSDIDQPRAGASRIAAPMSPSIFSRPDMKAVEAINQREKASA
jgi:hypothetical protein